MTPLRPTGEVLARELTLGTLSYADLARRVRMVAERLFTRRLPFLELVVVDPDQSDLVLVVGGDSATDSPVVRKSEGRDVESFSVRLDEPLLLGPDVGAECRSRGIAPPEKLPQSLLMIPLVREGKKLGALVMGLDMAPGTEITRRWSALAGATLVVAAALQSCREHEKTLADRFDLEKIAQAGARLQILASLPETSALVVRTLVEEFAFDRAILFLPSDDETRLEGASSVGYEEIHQLIRVSLDSETDILSKVFHSGSPWMAREANDSAIIPIVLCESGQIHDAVALPLRVGGQSVGVLWGDHRESRGRLSSHRVTLLTLFASQAAAAIANSRLLHRIETLAETDALTGVGNRRHLEGVLHREIARVRRKGTALSLLMIDVDEFKSLNDRFGHEYGDVVLREVATLLKNTLRETDLVARYGGDEFVILMPETSGDQAECAKRRLVEALGRFNDKRPADRPAIRLSLGLQVAEVGSVESILQDADRKMYQAKEEASRARLLEALIGNRREEIVQRDQFIANSLKVLCQKEPHFPDHSRRVMQLVLTIGRLASVSDQAGVSLALAALLHDIGKISVPSKVLNRAGPLTKEERMLVRTHCAFGEELLRGAAYLAPVKRIVLFHHERFDGLTEGPYGGYPEGLKGDEIPLGARILKIADCYDAITSWRCYQPARPAGAAVAILREEKGKAFDPELVDLFLGYLQPRLASTAARTPVVANLSEGEGAAAEEGAARRE